MCGICGLINSNNTAAVQGMLAAMNHRGPDDSGVYQQGKNAIGMTRLAIIDTTHHGHQPMSSTDKQVWIVYNGETYNFKTEKDILVHKGYQFSSHSDTEVVLTMYLEYGIAFLKRMRGMFALAIIDKRNGPEKEKLILARDHLGIKPLLFSRQGKALVFASELKAVLASGHIPKEMDPEALRQVLTFGSVIQPRTMLKNVHMLLPGHYLVYEKNTVTMKQYWELGTDRIPELGKLSYAEQTAYVEQALLDSVGLQMISDVPLGAFLSGGIDSSLLVAMMARLQNTKVRTFSVGFTSDTVHVDETAAAQRIARHIGTDHTRVEISAKDVRDDLSHFVRSLDQPSIDGLNSYFVSKATKRSVTVAISGTGGDELFAGYPWSRNIRDKAAHYRRTGVRIQGYVKSLSALPVFDKLSGTRFENRLERTRKSMNLLSEYAREHQIFGPYNTARVLSSALKEQCRAGREPSYDIGIADVLPNAGPLNRVSGLCLRGYTQNQLLRDIDATSMGHSLEVRVPFLDPRLADIALSLPDDAKLGPIDTKDSILSYRTTGAKKILFSIAKDYLPRDFDKQPKQGFNLPYTSWLTGDLRAIMEETLSSTNIKRSGLFNDIEVQQLKKDLLEGNGSWIYPWLLMIIELWKEQVLA